jgi:putative transposase
VITLVLHLLRLLPFFLGGHRQLALENLALRQQLAVYKRTAPARDSARPTACSGPAWPVWTGWRRVLVIVSPDTVLRWQRRRFREYWTRLSGRPRYSGRPPVSAEIAALVRTMASANPLWGAPRIPGELLKLGFKISERTVSRLMPRRRPEASQT